MITLDTHVAISRTFTHTRTHTLCISRQEIVQHEFVCGWCSVMFVMLEWQSDAWLRRRSIGDSLVMHVAEMCDRTRTSSGRGW